MITTHMCIKGNCIEEISHVFCPIYCPFRMTATMLNKARNPYVLVHLQQWQRQDNELVDRQYENYIN